jgi:hypothetical protein
MFGKDAFAEGDQLGWKTTAADQPDRLNFSEDAKQKLAELRAAVEHPRVQPAVTPRAGLTAGQERHLSSLETAETAIDKTNIKTQFVDLFQTRYFLTESAAERLYTDVVNHLSTTPLTITVKAKDWFGSGAPKSTKFTPAAAKVKETPVATVFGKPSATGNISHLPTWDDTNLPAAEQRKEDLAGIKDELMTGLNQPSSAEKAVRRLNVN